MSSAKNGTFKWLSLKIHLFNNCLAICNPPCENYAECIDNTCSCDSKKFEGKHCEFEKGCKTKPVTTNAAAKCDFEKCNVTCDTGYGLFNGLTEMELSCVERVWSPVQSITCKRKIDLNEPSSLLSSYFY